MDHASSALAEAVRSHRRTAGLSQEQLAEDAGLSVSVIRKIEQGGTARVETLHNVARALGVSTSTLFASGAPQPVVGAEDEVNRQLLARLRRALMPPVGLSETLADTGQAEDISELRRRIEDGRALYDADRYESIARVLPDLLHAAEATVASADGDDERRDALATRAHALLLAGKYCTQVRQYDMAYQALAEAIRIARELGEELVAAMGVDCMCWLFIRQTRFDEAETLAAATAERIEPRLSSAAQGHIAVWGRLCLRVAAAAARNNRADTAAEARRLAATAGSALNHEFSDYRTYWVTFGPVTAELKVVEDLALAGDSRGVLRRADDGLLSSSAMRKLGRPSTVNWNRHRLEVAKAQVQLGSTQDAMDELTRVRRTSGTWMRHQPLARDVMTAILHTRKRSLTREMREMAAHLNIQH